jgi:hypothetical protein
MHNDLLFSLANMETAKNSTGLQIGRGTGACQRRCAASRGSV